MKKKTPAVLLTTAMVVSALGAAGCGKEVRAATKEELEGVNRYIKSISKSTEIDFFSLC